MIFCSGVEAGPVRFSIHFPPLDVQDEGMAISDCFTAAQEES